MLPSKKRAPDALLLAVYGLLAVLVAAYVVLKIVRLAAA